MGAVASAMARKGYVVTGTDANVYPPMSTFLESEGIEIFQGFKPDNIPADTDLVVIGNAMSRGNVEVEAVLEKNLRYMSLPETMKEFFLWGKKNYVVTGTHGKTTTSSMLAWLMKDNGLDPSFMIGGIARNLGRGGNFTTPTTACLRVMSMIPPSSTNAPSSCTTCPRWLSSTTLRWITQTSTPT